MSLPRRQQRALLAALALRAGEVVSTDRLVEDLWGERAPATAHGSLQNTVLALRKALGRDLVVTQAPGYRLALEPEVVDANRFERLLAEARDMEPVRKAALLEEALALWRGPALADLDEEPFARLAAGHLDELRVVAKEERIEAELALGRHAALVGELETLLATTNPPRERICGQLMVALYRCGRQAEALEVYRSLRLALADELGLDPSKELQELERKILNQDPELDPPAGEKREAAPPAAERRLVSVLAALPPREDDAEQLRRRLDELLMRVRDILDRNDGMLERFGPELLVAVFGAEAPRDDDALRAVRAADELGLQSGIATGESVGGAGAVFTRAAELARLGGLQVDDRTRTLVQHERRLDAPLVGRVEELARLRDAFEAAKEKRRCCVVTVLGEAGIGKTRLGRELTTALAGEATTVVGRCFSYGKGQTFLPLLDALQEIDLAASLADDAEGELAATRLAALTAQDAGTLGESYWALRRLLEALARTRPVLLLLDDVHWAEPALLDLVDYLAERVVAAPLLIVSLARPELERPVGEQLLLGPLGSDEARQLVAGLADLDEATQDRVVELADGNALYAEQLAAYAAENGTGLPPTLEAVLAGRIGRLADPERRVLQRAAVAGREFTRGVVAALSDEPIDGQLSSLTRRSIVHPAPTTEPGDDGYRFHHVLLRDAAYATLTKIDRAALHERVADWLDRDGTGDDALAGYHLEQAALSRRDLGVDAHELAARAGERLGEAGMQVWRQNDVAAAGGLLERALSLLPPGRRRAELLWERAITLRIGDRLRQAEATLASAEREAKEAGAKSISARVACERADIRLYAGRLSLGEAIATYANALPILRRADDLRGLARAELLLSGVHHLACRHDEFGAAAARAERHYVAAGFSSGVCLGIQAEALYYGAVPVTRALSLCSDLLERSTDRTARAAVTAVIGGLHALEGRCEEGRLLLSRSRSLYEEIGAERGLLTVWTPLCVELETIAGNHDLAEARARESLEALESAGDSAYASTHALQLAELLIAGGASDEVDRLVRLAEEGALASDVLVQFWWRSLRARLLARAGDAAAAEEMGRDAVEIASLTDSLRNRSRAHFALAEVLRQATKKQESRAEATAGRKLLRQKGATALLERRRTSVGARR